MNSSENPPRPWDLVGQMGRRRFLKLLGASMAMAGLPGCNREQSYALPYVVDPNDVTPGDRQFYVSTLAHRGFGRGVVVESVMGRPIKVDGYSAHPASLGGSDATMQASLLDLYDPDRLRWVRHREVPTALPEFFEWLSRQTDSLVKVGGQGLHILTESLHSPSLQALLERVLGRLPEANWHRYQAFDDRTEGTREPLQIQYHLQQADVIFSLDEDFLGEHPYRVRYARDFGHRREPHHMNQLWVAESSISLTGANADHRFHGTALDLQRILEALLAGREPEPQELRGLLRVLQAHSGRSLVMGGPGVNPGLVHQLNQSLGNVGSTVTYSPTSDLHPLRPSESLARLRVALQEERVRLLLILGGDPVYVSGGALEVSGAATSVHLTTRANATSAACEWVVPQSHPLESWGDLYSWDGSISLMQPLIEPLYEGSDPYEVLGALLGEGRSAYQQVRAYWQKRQQGDFEENWQRWLREGLLRRGRGDISSASVPATLPGPVPQPVGEEVVVRFRPDPYLGDGKTINNPWLLEMGRPLTRLAWSNAAIVSEKWAHRHELKDGDHVQVSTDRGHLVAPIHLQPGHPDKVVTLTLGWGQRQVGRFGSGRGYDAFALRGPENPVYVLGQMKPVEGHTELISLQHLRKLEGRDLVRQAHLEEWKENPGLGIPAAPEHSLYPDKEFDARRWGMVIDLSKCIGCNACVAACNAENNIPVVGPEETARGRAMHWLRVDRYEDGRGAFQPVPCMHCENAPCEQVCPVEATLHNREGLNQMVYNRCVGTRYCANNCPYEVRRFNFLDYTNSQIDEWKLARNPEVSVRSRGVMEKCSYCVQRIEAADIRARVEERGIADGEVRTACQVACPTRAIVFGDLSHSDSEVSQQAEMPHNYGMLEELNTRPRTTYLAQLWNVESDQE